ncbi:E3 ubiquitin-protein ligase RSL1-like [Lycium ferocissimum]|uniref:E3 ubiquitin-protein ligase RSL1-like n=1 Tax=Lycium ferocissimum TaxID=112874 RepID=UPI0028169B17|nr:E3 ubiquitin-protein ligase RSL1-like [Lycium ferocissimum]
MEVASSSSAIKIIDITDDNDDNDDVLILYATPRASKNKGKMFTDIISVEEYLCSKPSSSGTKKVIIDLIDDDQDDEIQFLGTQFGSFTCDICVDEKSTSEIFKIMGCTHSYCKDCMAKYVGSKIQENISRISCPVLGCNGQLEPHICRSILPKQVFDRWGDVLCEAMILGCEKFYCPFKDCSALLIDENSSSSGGGDFVVTQSECPECRRLFCAKCEVAWHSGILCEEFQKLNKDEREKEDLQLMQLAKGQEWQRCPRCRIYVARSSGCAQMRCRCGCYFCYKCGAESTNHHCKRCGVLNGL